MRASGYQIDFQLIVVEPDEIKIVDFALLSYFGSIFGMVTRTDNSPVIGALIEIIKDNIVIAQTLTDLSGNYIIDGLAQGEYIVHATFDTLQNAFVTANVLSFQSTEVNFSLLANPSSLRGNIFSSRKNTFIPNAIIRLLKDDILLFIAQSDANGHFLMEGLTAGEYIIEIFSEGFKSLKIQLSIGQGEDFSQNFYLISLERPRHGGGGGFISRYPNLIWPEPIAENFLGEEEMLPVEHKAKNAELDDIGQSENETHQQSSGCAMANGTTGLGNYWVILWVIHLLRLRRIRR